MAALIKENRHVCPPARHRYRRFFCRDFHLRTAGARALIGPVTDPSQTLVLCATSRLAQSLRWQDNRSRAKAGEVRWPTLDTATVAQWFAILAEKALLRGLVNADSVLARRVLDAYQEALLWEQVIGDSIPD